MATYELLTRYLNNQRTREIVLSIEEIEAIVGDTLPTSARTRPQYWANVVRDEQRSSPNRAVRKAGYSAFLIPSDQKVRFVRD
ncbi:hypothetical protein FJ959_09740 [Mesorhizobium sp. B2-2-4]|nr:hypothetical protein FJ959_09740 [Mesorhizobium sp. B2-2-4]TPM67625.1 hypothetical protein FJ965_10880 [Mesorhizobium sp. B2-2-1]TPN66907.1 hypothetical protein FJ984_15745 [Mesorhizobium sp. B1-1-3]